jgi:glutaredoxin 2
MRSVLDPKRHYRKENTRTVGADAKKLAGPRFEVGTLLADATESAAHKTRRKDQKQTIVEELLADTDRRAYLKRKQAEIDQQKRSGGKGFYKKVKDRRGSRFSKSAK